MSNYLLEMKSSHYLVILTLLLFTQTIQAQFYTFGNTPEWVNKLEIPKEPSVSKYDVTSGFYLTLADYQAKVDEDAFYIREVSNIVSYSGVTNASQLSITYDSSYQELILHHLIIWRKGKKIDRTKDLSIEILNNENDLDKGIYTGTITAYDNLEDIRKNDLIDFAYTLVGKNPIFGDSKYLFYPLESMNPVDMYSVRFMYPEDKQYAFNCIDCDSTIKISNVNEGGYKQTELVCENLKPLKVEDYIPTWDLPYKYFTLSSFNSWNEVNEWAQDIFSLPKEQDLNQVFEEIFDGSETTEEKINKIIDYVQDDIRYMGIESGIGSIKPFTPEKVVKQRFGDCKDKSLLLVTLLKKIGVEKAYPVLVNTSLKNSLDQQQPSAELFNHCIAKYEFQDSIYWLDPTISVQGGDFKEVYTPDYGKVLVVGENRDSLQTMTTKTDGATIYIEEEYFMNSFTEPALLEVKSVRSGYEADQRRALLEYYQLEDLSKSVTDEMKLYFPHVEKIDEIKIDDDIEKNLFTVKYKYEVDGFWQDGNKSSNYSHFGYWLYRFEPQSLYYYLTKSACSERENDYEVIYPVNLSYRAILHFPKEILISDDINLIENEIISYNEITEQIDKNSIVIDYQLKIKKDHIKAESFMDICEELNDLVEHLPQVIYFLKK